MATGDEQYIKDTIIDGGQNGSTVYVENTQMCRLMGLTIQNGTGTNRDEGVDFKCGGGIYTRNNSSNLIYHCIIKDNFARDGGGIYIDQGEVMLYSSTISGNHAIRLGGGFTLHDGAQVHFEEDYPCNIYLNYAAAGCELSKSYDSPPLTVIVDTFTVINPNRYFFDDRDQLGVPLNDITLNIQHGLLEPISADLYVSAEGDNNNSGLTPDDPLQSINLAYSMIDSDSLNPHTIHLADGIYSPTLNNQSFPIQTRGFISLSGESEEETIFDAEFKNRVMASRHSKYNFTIQNLTVMRADYVDYSNNQIFNFSTYFDNSYWIKFNNISVKESSNVRAFGIARIDTELDQINIFSNNCSGVFWDNADLTAPKTCTISNSKFFNNTASSNSEIKMYSTSSSVTGDLLNTVNIVNTEATNNVSYDSDWPRLPTVVWADKPKIINIVNSTFGDNRSMDGGCTLSLNSEVQANIYNSILYGNTDRNIYLENNGNQPCTLTVKNSLLEGGEWDIGLIGNNYVDYDEETVLDENPLWAMTGEFPYMLTEDSPCIDTGTLDLPEGVVLPEFDLAGNTRIYGNGIDMGAYEFQDSVAVNEDVVPEINNTKISNYPNPFNPATNIKFELAQSGEVELAVYNIKGQKVKTLMDAYLSVGVFNLTWKGKDEDNNYVASGTYFAKCSVDGEVVTAKKMTLLK